MKVIWPINTATSTKGKVFVGLSGGVDSAVSAALLQEQGYEVTGVFIRIALDGYPCTAGEDKIDAMRVAAHLRIPFRSIDLSEAYKKKVFEISVAEFAKGRTPNPDTLCNKEIKFGLFFNWCIEQGADMVATGHYAVRKDGALYMGADEQKDQTYFLWAMPQKALRKTLFPVGGMHKPQVRALAAKFNLPNAERKDSQGLCFLGPVSVSDMLHQELTLVPGAVLDSGGAVIGTHEGAAAYTLGQRHGFELSIATPERPAYFVVGKNIADNTITVSPERYPQGVRETVAELSEENWIGEVPEGAYMARFRYRQTLIPARKEGRTVVLLQPHYIPEGQSLVLYKGAQCLGGGIVDKSSLR